MSSKRVGEACAGVQRGKVRLSKEIRVALQWSKCSPQAVHCSALQCSADAFAVRCKLGLRGHEHSTANANANISKCMSTGGGGLTSL